MQNYLRQQSSAKNINLVTEVCAFLSTLYNYISGDTVKLAIQTFQTLIELSVVSRMSGLLCIFFVFL